MNVRQGIISTILDAFQAERSIYGAYHLLKGKKSAQTIQDGSFFSVLSYFGIFPTIRRFDIEEDVQALIDNNDAIRLDDDCIRLTEQGREKLKQIHLERPTLHYIKGWDYHAYTETFWLRLCLFLQALSHLLAKTQTIYPITHQTVVQQWVKAHMPRSLDERKKRLTQLHDELLCFLSSCQNEQAMVFVHQLSGKSKIGLTRQQLGDQMGMDAIDVYLYHIATLHQLFMTIEKHPAQFPVLALFLADMKKEFILTESTRQTLHMLKAGRSAEAISKRRRLKLSTIEDHIVEIALQHPRFSIRSFVSEEAEKAILALSAELKTSRLREIKEKLPPDISYFMIRLVLARKKVEHGT